MVADKRVRPALALWERFVKSTFQTEVAFPSYRGGEASHIERVMEAAAKTVGHSLPTATTFRKAIEVRNKRLPDPLREAVSRDLCHPSGTAEAYYRASSTRDIVQTYKRIGAIIEGMLGGSPDKTPPPPTLDQDASSPPTYY